MRLEDLGYRAELENYRIEENLTSFIIGRVTSEHKERYTVKTEKGEFESEILGSLRFSAKSRSDFPAVGDWVAISEYDEDKGLIHAVLPRKTIVARKGVNKFGEKQIIATNIDYAFIVQAADQDFNINRLERYLTICYTSKVKPIIILTKIDLISDFELNNILNNIEERIKQVPTIAISNETHDGYDKLDETILKGMTYCLLGSSGVGKSTLTNNLSGKSYMKTNSISVSTNKGRHITSHRELIVIENGGILIDNPGMREVGITDTANGIDITFDSIAKFSKDCKYSDCTHVHEKGCAVIDAVDKEEIDRDSYDNYLKMEKEREHFESSIVERRKKDKDLGKMIKNFKNIKKQIKG